MASSIAACVFGGARLISSASTMLAKTGPWTNWNSRRPSAPSCRMSVPVMSIGIRSGVNWMRLNLSDIVSASLLTKQRLGQSRHAHQQGVPAGEQADRQPLDDVALADDDAAQLLPQSAHRPRASDRSPGRHGRSDDPPAPLRLPAPLPVPYSSMRPRQRLAGERANPRDEQLFGSGLTPARELSGTQPLCVPCMICEFRD